MKTWLSLVLILVLLVGGGGVAYKVAVVDKTAASEIEMSINPNVVFTVNSSGKVLSVQAKNEDGQTILANVDVTGMEIDAAVDVVVRYSIISGHFSLSGQEVNVKVNGKSDKQGTKLEASIKKTVETVCSEIDIKCSINIEDFSNYKAEAEELGVAVKKYALINEARLLAPEKTDNELKEMNEKELIKLISEKRDEYKGLAYSQYNAIIEGTDDAVKGIIDSIKSVKVRIEDAEIQINRLLDKYPGKLNQMAQSQIDSVKEDLEDFKASLQQKIEEYQTAKSERIAECKLASQEAISSARQTLKSSVESHESSINSLLTTLQEAGKLSEKQINEWKALIEKCK